MSHKVDMEKILRDLPPTTRREFLKQAAVLGAGAAAVPVFLRNPLIVEAAPSAKRGGLVKVMGHQEVSSLSPDDAAPSVHWVMVSQMHNGLIELNEYNVIERVLAESYDVSKDGLRYAFNLRKGVKFHDGS